MQVYNSYKITIKIWNTFPYWWGHTWYRQVSWIWRLHCVTFPIAVAKYLFKSSPVKRGGGRPSWWGQHSCWNMKQVFIFNLHLVSRERWIPGISWLYHYCAKTPTHRNTKSMVRICLPCQLTYSEVCFQEFLDPTKLTGNINYYTGSNYN